MALLASTSTGQTWRIRFRCRCRPGPRRWTRLLTCLRRRAAHREDSEHHAQDQRQPVACGGPGMFRLLSTRVRPEHPHGWSSDVGRRRVWSPADHASGYGDAALNRSLSTGGSRLPLPDSGSDHRHDDLTVAARARGRGCRRGSLPPPPSRPCRRRAPGVGTHPRTQPARPRGSRGHDH